MISPTAQLRHIGNTPLATIIIAVYNRVRFLRGTVYSALRQSLTNIEILIIDDGSTDGTGEIAEELTRADQRVRLIRLPHNSGPSVARNAGLDQARGEWIAILDADDLCMPNRLERQIQFLRQTGVDLCGSWFVEFGRGLARTVRWPHNEADLRAAMLFQSAICHPTVMARKAVFDRYRYRDELHLAEDYDLFARAMSEFRLANVPEALLRYRRHAGQATSAQRSAMETVTKDIRLAVLAAQGISATEDEKRIHNLIRAPQSIVRANELDQIEAWLLKLLGYFDHRDAKHVVASQWTRAAVRAAPLGWTMWHKYRASPLHKLLGKRAAGDMDLAVLAALRLDYGSRAFEALRRFGLSA